MTYLLSYLLFLQASDNPSLSSNKKTSNTISLAIALRDINDNKPIFKHQQPCMIYVSDDAPVSSEVTTIEATDLDAGVNQQIEYALISNTDSAYFNKYFTFTNKTSGIFVKQSLDLNKQNLTSKQIKLDVIAKDKGKH